MTSILVAGPKISPPIAKYDQTCASKDHEMQRDPSPDGHVRQEMRRGPSPDFECNWTYLTHSVQMQRGLSAEFECDWTSLTSIDQIFLICSVVNEQKTI